MPLGGCVYCFSGQLALWYYIYYAIVTGAYNALYHIAFVSVAILTAEILNHILKNNNDTKNY